eukprot:1973509-Prymnesium_polylepis.1
MQQPSMRSPWQCKPKSAPIMRPRHAAPAPSTASPACGPPRPAGVARCGRLRIPLAPLTQR